MNVWRVPAAVAALLGGIAAPAAGQAESEPATRAEIIAARQAAKAEVLEPEEPSAGEAVVARVRTVLLESPSGAYPLVGSVRSGGGFAFGGGYRRYYRGDAYWDLHGLYSIRGYKRVELGTASVADTAVPGRFEFALRTGWLDVTRLAYYGAGMDTEAEDRTNSRLRQTYAGGSVRGRLHPWVTLRGEADVEHYVLGSGQGPHPSIETVHAAAAAPGLGETAAFARVGGTAAFDWRESPGYTKSGGYYGATLRVWFNQDSVYAFERLDVDLVQHVPILRETWVLALRGRMQSILDDGDIVPFYLLPALGSGRTLRAYPTDRFRDRHALLLSAEWRWAPNRHFFDMALFFDAGKVAPRREDLDLRGLRTNWGIGARFHGPSSTPLRMELARGREGWGYIFSASPAF